MANTQFECQYCTTSLLGKKYVLKDDHLYCVSCYDRIFSNYCEQCKEPIESDSKVGITSVDMVTAHERWVTASEWPFSLHVDFLPTFSTILSYQVPTCSTAECMF